MKKQNSKMTALVAMTFAICTCFVNIANADSLGKHTNFIPYELWLDTDGEHINAHGGGLLFHEGTYYWFGEHKLKDKQEINKVRFDVTKSCDGGVSCYSSKDLLNWKNEGVVLGVDYEDPKSDIAYGCVLERPKVIYNAKTRKFVMWFHLELKGEHYKSARSGVAVADTPTGPFKFIESFRPNDSEARDQTLYVDDDGKAYHLYSSERNNTMHISLLTDDYLKPSGDYVRAFENERMEAPAVFKHNNKYYIIASRCTGWSPNDARGAVADSIRGPWKMIGNPCKGINPHNNLGAKKTYGGQSNYILKVNGKEDTFIAMFDIWRPKTPRDGRYIWLPIKLTDDAYEIWWSDSWNFSNSNEKPVENLPEKPKMRRKMKAGK